METTYRYGEMGGTGWRYPVKVSGEKPSVEGPGVLVSKEKLISTKEAPILETTYTCGERREEAPVIVPAGVKRWLLLMEQRGQGCDYSIGCGRTWVEFDADDLKAAIERARLHVLGIDTYYYDSVEQYVSWEQPSTFDKGPTTVAVALLYPASWAYQCPAGFWLEEADALASSGVAAATEYAERGEYERLKAKYG